MDILLKINENTFKLIKNGEKTTILHGFSKNKKYLRLFKQIDKFELKCAKTQEVIEKTFKQIKIIEENSKKYFEIKFI